MNNNVSEKDIVAYFDFDGTITSHDTLIPFVLYVIGLPAFLFKLPQALIISFLYICKYIDNENAKQRFLTLTLRGRTHAQLELCAKNFALTKLDKYIKPEIYAKLEYHIEHWHRIILVSANLGIYLRYWVKKHNLIDVIATEIEFVDDIATGKLATRNCYGEQKIKRLMEYLAVKSLKFAYSYGYGNSAGDYALLKYVDEAYWVTDGSLISWEDYCRDAKF